MEGRGSSWKEQSTSIMPLPNIIVLKFKGKESIRLEKAKGRERKEVSLVGLELFFPSY